MLWYTLTTLLQSQLLWIWRFESITAYLKDARNNNYIIRDIHPVILQQLLSLLTSGINSSNQDFLKPDDLQLQVSTAPSSIYLLLDQLQNQQSYGYRLCAQRLTVFNGARPSGKTRALSCCGKLVIEKQMPKSRFKFNSDSSKNIHAIQTETTKQQDSRKPIQFPLKKQLSSARQPSNFDDLNMDMMKTVDCNVHKCDESGM
ncbi:hypothetical protein BASA83_008160 [Batrachochytrium salamandrivorans]|nr:hypothetical protein BASA83_008160 [Batrachochytrium salamandrivorans]